ncbi:MAG: MBL fold metallo-hydrolase [Lentisphaerae bacterium]|jgi:phosphoribosyl 1,2-cyclic phosphodiesterase|nr:MBL fold metallo-hydrolase [Lentisphaerota bacterium]
MSDPIGVTILGSGSSGNATIVHCGDEGIVIDAGFSFREFKKRYKQSGLPKDLKLRGILVTHEHADHVKGLRVCSNELDIPIFATRMCADVLRMRDDQFGQMSLIAAGGHFSLGGFEVVPFSVPHDANDPVGYVICRGSCRVGIATDVGNANNTVKYELRNCDTLVLESNHDLNMLAASQRPWSLKQRIMGSRGHLSNVATAELLGSILGENTRNVILAHISRECNKPEIAMDNARKQLEQMGRNDINLTYATQENPLETIWN